VGAGVIRHWQQRVEGLTDSDTLVAGSPRPSGMRSPEQFRVAIGEQSVGDGLADARRLGRPGIVRRCADIRVGGGCR
jgi:hypothetical protein